MTNQSEEQERINKFMEKLLNLRTNVKIQYIKLGEKGRYWNDCKKENIIKLGFDSGKANVLELMKNGDWEKITQKWKEERSGTPQQFTNQMKSFFEDDGTTLWITFEDECLYYGFTDGGDVIPDINSEDSYRKMDSNGWLCRNKKGEILSINQLSGKLTKTAAYRQTICSLKHDVETYLIQRLLGENSDDVRKVIEYKEQLEFSIQKLIKELTWQDFEVLVELIFVNSGWRRVSSTGGSQKTIDIGLENPITGDAAFVQIKSNTTQKQLDEYIEKMKESYYERMFYVFHTHDGEINTEDTDVSLWDVNKISKLVVSNGLVDWVIKRIS
jgi:hypothetical protein